MKQLKFIPAAHFHSRKEHGGSLLLGKRRKKRPLSIKLPLHLVLRSDYATSSRSLLRYRPLIERVVKKAKNKFHIRVYEMAIVSNHIHLLVKGQRREDIQNFFRVVAGHIAQEILRQFPILDKERGNQLLKSQAQAQKELRAGGAPKAREKENKFWQTRIYSRIVSWGREYLIVKKYVLQNTREALGLIPYKSRTKKARVRSKNHKTACFKNTC